MISPKTGLQPLNTATHHCPLKLIILAGPQIKVIDMEINENI